MKLNRGTLWLVLPAILLISPAAALGAEAVPASTPVESDAPGCASKLIELTPASVLELLDGAEVVLMGESEVHYVSSDTKVSRQRFRIPDGNGGWRIGVTSCSGTCTGNGCGVSGCTAEAGGCDPCSCTGGECGAECECSHITEVE